MNKTQTLAQGAHSLVSVNSVLLLNSLTKVSTECNGLTRRGCLRQLWKLGGGRSECFVYINSFKPLGKLMRVALLLSPPFMDKKTEAQKGLVTCPQSHRYYMTGLRFEPRQPDSKAHTLNFYALLHPLGTSWAMRKGFRAEGASNCKIPDPIEMAQWRRGAAEPNRKRRKV